MSHTRLHSRFSRPLIHVGALAIVVALSWAARSAVTFAQDTTPTVSTDSDVYVAGDTVTITGQHFVAGEIVTVEVKHANGIAEPAVPSVATVEADGTFKATWVVSGDDLSGPQLAAAVTGTVSGQIPPTSFVRVADLATDKGDYMPGQTVLISGRGFGPNELVRLQVNHITGQSDGAAHQPFYESADAAGNLAATWFVNPDAFGFHFAVIAKGELSAVGGIATFWDAGPINLTTLDAPISQNFDSLATTGTANTWTDNTTLDGWYSQQTIGATTAPTTYRADSGGSNTGAIYSWGVAGGNALTERAFGSVASGTPGNFLNAVRLVNNTGATIATLDVSFIGEQWRAGGCTPTPCTPAAQKLDFQYQVANAGVITDANTPSVGWNDDNALDFTSPTPGTSTAAALDGNLAANRTAIASTLTVTVNPGQEIWLRWLDTNDANNDHGLAIDDFSVTPHGAVATPSLTVTDVSANETNAGTTTFSFTVNLSVAAGPTGVTFDIATADGTAQDGTPGGEDSDYVARSLIAQTIPAGSTTYTFGVQVNGDLAAEPNETFFVNVSNVDGATVSDPQGQGTILNDDFALSFIHDVQGSGDTSPLSGNTVMVEGVVVADFQGANQLKGFFLQEEDTDFDASPATSEGIFVFCNTCSTPIAEGQRVKVTGAVSEFNNMTQITASAAGSVVVTDAGNHLGEVTPSPIDLPIAGSVDDFYEAREGMKVTFTDTLTVSEYFELARFGQIILYEGGRPRQFTEANAPSVAGNAAHLDNLTRREVILDDDNNAQESFLASPDGSQYVYHPRANGGFSGGIQGTDFFRGGDLVNGLTGVLHWSFPGFGANTWRIRPTEANPATFTATNLRPATPPAVGGAIKVVGMNLLNYFTTIDTTASTSAGPCAPSGTLDCRGADSVAELNRQRARAVVVICTLNADIYAFAELENTTPSATITDLLGAVNASCGGAHPYAYVDTGGTLGTDAIRVQQIYRTGIVSPFGAPLSDMDPVHNRPPTAQTFDVVDAANPAFGQRFTVIANHFKSKGCPGSGGDADSGDGQGCFNATRTAQATRLLTWINGTVLPAAGDPDVLLLGDFNSYAKEDPVVTLQTGGYNDLETTFHGANAYSYLFDGQLGHLDYAFANTSFQAQITGADAWHINADEVPLFDYNDEIFDSPGEATFDEKPDGSALTPPRVVFEPGTPYRASDHDPVVVGLFQLADVSITKTDSPDPVSINGAVIFTLTITNNGPNDATGVTAIDVLPAGITFVPASSSPECTNSSGTVTCTVGALANGASVTRTIAITAPSTPGTLSNTATVSSSSADPNSANNSSTSTTDVQAADLSITKSDSPDPVSINGPLTFTLTVTNNGPNDATGVTATDTLPSGVTFVSASSGCTYSSGVVTCAIGALANGASVVRTINVTAPSTAGTMSNTASVTGGPGDPSTANNSATETTAVQAADLSITKTDSPDPVSAGGTLTYTLTVTNNGPNNATGVTTTDVLPAGVGFVSASSGCVNSVGTVTCTIGALANGASVTRTIVVTAPSTPGAVSNTASVSGSPADPNTANNSSTATTTVNPIGTADLSIKKDGDPGLVLVGNTLTYTLRARNNGPSSATGVTTTDVLPAGLSYVSSASTQGTCTYAAATRTVLCTLGSLVSGGSATITIKVIPMEAGVVTNKATIAGAQSDPNNQNNTSTDSTLVLPSADLSITQTDAPDPVRVNNTLTYTLTIKNVGPSSPTHVGVFDTLPDRTQFISVTRSQGNCFHDGGEGSDSVVCDLGTLAPGATATVTIKVKPTKKGAIVNNASTGALMVDPNLSNNSSSATTTVNP